MDGIDELRTITDTGSGDFLDKTSFVVREGLCGDAGYISFESATYPGKFIRHAGFVLRLHDKSNSDLYKKDSCFKISKQLCEGSVSLYAVNFPGHLVTKCGDRLRLNRENDFCGNPENRCWVLGKPGIMIITF